MAASTTTSGLFEPTPPSQYPSETLNHLLSLPPLLQPLSPSLAALHLARVRLLLSVPASPFSGGVAEWWCHSCGGLREGLGGWGTNRRKRVVVEEDGVGTGGRRKKAECGRCGASFQRPKPVRRVLEGFLPARTRSERTTARKEKLVPEVVISTNSVPSLSPDPATLPPEAPIEQVQPTIPRPTLLSTPSLTYIPTSAPNPPTYPEPIPTKRAASPILGAKGAKRRKKSGLAQLLAENRERQEREEKQTGSSSWGL